MVENVPTPTLAVTVVTDTNSPKSIFTVSSGLYPLPFTVIIEPTVPIIGNISIAGPILKDVVSDPCEFRP